MGLEVQQRQLGAHRNTAYMIHSIFVVDDHYMVIEGLRSLLLPEENIHWLGHATTGGSCLSFLQNEQPDVLFLDVNLPDISGTELCKVVKKAYPQVQILGLSTFHQQAVIRNMMDFGASGYLLNNASKFELLEAIRTVRSGGKFFSKEALNVMREASGNLLLVTKREKEVLRLIAEGLTNADIAERLFISLPTVNTHRKSLLEKLEAKNTALLISKAVKLGLV